MNEVARFTACLTVALHDVIVNTASIWVRTVLGSVGTSVAACLLFGAPEQADVFRLVAAIQVTVTLITLGTTHLSAREWATNVPLESAGAKSFLATTHRSAAPCSIHVPVGHEPLDLVQRCLRSLSQLRYPDFEVLVVVNNAPKHYAEEVQLLLADLEPRFHVLYEATLPGAKAAALNLALASTRADAQLVCVVDCDYEVEPSFLADAAAWLQTEYDAVQVEPRFRAQTAVGCAARLDQRWFLERHLPARTRCGDPPMLGSLLVLRREVLTAVGGWNERALTEDSELGLRLWASGHKVKFSHDAAGVGTIPLDFAALKKQRLRWTYGPVQQLVANWRLVLQTGTRGPGSGYLQSASNVAFLVLELNALALCLLMKPTRIATIPVILVVVAASGLWAIDRRARIKIFRSMGATVTDALQALSIDSEVISARL